MHPRPVIVVSDAQALGDDGVAITLLITSMKVDLRMIAATSGNVWVDEAYDNLCKLVSRLGRPEIAVARGLPALVHRQRWQYFDASERGREELIYAGALGLPARPNGNAQNGHTALRRFVDTIKSAGQVDIVLLAPASILAAALQADPDLPAHIGRVFAMGGAIYVPGNSTPAAEFNMWFDPPAAEDLFSSTVPLTLVTLDATIGAVFPSEFGKSLDVSLPHAAYLADYLARRRKATPQPMWDEVLAAIVISPELILRSTNLILGVDLSLGPNYGACRSISGTERRPIQIVLEVDHDRLTTLVEKYFKGPQ